MPQKEYFGAKIDRGQYLIESTLSFGQRMTNDLNFPKISMVIEDDWIPARIDGETADFPKKWPKIEAVFFRKGLSFQANSAYDNAF